MLRPRAFHGAAGGYLGCLNFLPSFRGSGFHQGFRETQIEKVCPRDREGRALENEAKRESMGKALELLNKEIIPKVKPQSPEWYDFKRKMIEVYL
ncbi:MAG: hypothetical protein MUO50_06820, partial [Longimicrobiales bacterium]|nr:hypothetical protein [Longimicrobiales bacterium]